MVNIKSPKCRCGRAVPYFGMPGDARPSYCANCKEDEMVNIRSRKCRCGRAIPHFGMPGDARATCCASCKEDGMVDIKSRKCRCGRTQPFFGMPGDARATCCANCREDGMENIVSLRCLVCGKQAHFPDATGKPRQFCAMHAAEIGAHVLSSSIFSRAASDCLDILEEEVGYRFTFRHRFDASSGTWSGKEFAGLIPKRAFLPDAYHPERREVVEFLGNYYHGFPVEHPRHSSFICVGGKPAPDVYGDTMERLDLFTAEGLSVFYIWEHEFVEWRKRASWQKRGRVFLKRFQFRTCQTAVLPWR
ncbi:unnamed protein product [Effrenium voratum]|nr:unnamed protein product [Effrenium voratum]